MRILLLIYVFSLFISCGSSTGEEFSFTVSDLPQAKINSKLLVNKSTMYFLSSSRKDMNNICFDIKINDSNLKEQIKNSSFRLLHNGNRFEHVSMFPPMVSEEGTVYICFHHYRMEGTKFDSVVNSMENVSTTGKIKITRDLIREVELYFYLNDNDSILVPMDSNTNFSFYLRDKSMMNVR